jgi:cellulose synthase/poly-beta-1,6-N-acetylglucosamine synthase-like glycosyltransferase
MKLRIILIILINISFMSCNNYQKVLSDFNLHSYYLALDVKYNNHIMPIVMENAEFYTLIDNDTLSEKDYINMMQRILKRNNPFNLKDKMLYNKLKEYQVDTNQANLEKFKNVKDKNMINSFFNKDGVLELEMNEKEKRYLIYILFKSDVFVKIDDETGFLYIP